MIQQVWHNIKKYLGWRNWAVFYYNSILENLFILFYIGLVKKEWTNLNLLNIGIYILFSIFATSYGYLVNDLADKELDAKQNKPNTFSNDSKRRSITVVLLFFFLSILLSLLFINKFLFLPVMGLWFFFASFYSLKPIRFKEQGLVGLIIIILTQRVIPVILVFLAFEYYELVDLLLVILLLFMRGAVSDINHQLVDALNDQTTDTNTFAVIYGIDKMRNIFQKVLILERIFLISTLALISWRLYEFQIWGIPIFVYTLILYCVLIIFLNFYPIKTEFPNPFSEQKNLYQVIHLVFPNIILPVFLLLPLIQKNINYIIFILLYIFIYKLYKIETLKNSFIGRYFSTK